MLFEGNQKYLSPCKDLTPTVAPELLPLKSLSLGLNFVLSWLLLFFLIPISSLDMKTTKHEASDTLLTPSASKSFSWLAEPGEGGTEKRK